MSLNVSLLLALVATVEGLYKTLPRVGPLMERGVMMVYKGMCVMGNGPKGAPVSQRATFVKNEVNMKT